MAKSTKKSRVDRLYGYANRFVLFCFIAGLILNSCVHFLTNYMLNTFPDRVYESVELADFVFRTYGFSFMYYYSVFNYAGFTLLVYITFNATYMRMKKNERPYVWIEEYMLIGLFVFTGIAVLWLRVDNLVHDLTTLSNVISSLC